MTKSKTNRRKRYRYVMTVVETLVSTTAVESERKLTYEELRNETETRRVRGELSLKGVTSVNAWCEAAYRDGKEDLDGIAH